jgi:valyl-tRNA synthetase
MNKDGTMNENAGEFEGQDRFVARRNVVKRLEVDGALVKVEDYRHTVPYSDRGKVPVEPLLSTQWFVKIRPMADRALEFLDAQQEPVFVPERWTKVYRDWLVNLRDWCISRQLWWGHQIPAWYAISETGGEIRDNTPFVVANDEAEAREKAIAQFGESVQLEQDPDVLDTWFSAGLWPFSTLGWPDQTVDLATYYPTTTLVTGFDIIFFWVARMTLMGGHFTGQMPFKTVYIHGLVRDEHNKKMSKSSNNGIDPLLLIAKYGTDALRYTLIREVAGAGQDIRLDYNRKTAESASVEASRNFTNKLWNASRFVMMNLDGQTPEQLGEPQNLELCDRWILSRYNRVMQQTNQQIDQYGLGEAAKGLYEFIWGDFCDWYIELVKSRLQEKESASGKAAQQTLASVLEGILRSLHPFMPHITEELWQTLTQANGDQSLAVQSYPEANQSLINLGLEQQFELLIGTIRTVRNLRAEAEIKPGVKIQTFLQSDSDREQQILISGQAYIQDLAKIERLTIGKPDTPVAPPEFAEPLPTSPFNLEDKPGLLGKYQKPAMTLAVFLGGLVLLRIISAVLGVIDHLFLIASVLKLIGAGYTTWFIYRYLLKSGDRQELIEKISQMKAQVTHQATTVKARVITDEPQQMIAGVVGTVQVLIPLEGVVDVEALQTKLQRDLTKVESEIVSLTQRLRNANFVDKAPPDVVQGVRDALAEAEIQAEILKDRLNRLRGIKNLSWRFNHHGFS